MFVFLRSRWPNCFRPHLNWLDLFVSLEVNAAHAVILRSTKFNHLIGLKSSLSDLELALCTFLLFLPGLDDVLLGLGEFVDLCGLLQIKLANLFLINFVKFVSQVLPTNCTLIQVKLVYLRCDVLRLGNNLRRVIVIRYRSCRNTHSLCCFGCCVFLWPLLRQLDRASQNFVRLDQCLVAVRVLSLWRVKCVFLAERAVVVVIVVIRKAIGMLLKTSVATRVWL